MKIEGSLFDKDHRPISCKEIKLIELHDSDDITPIISDNQYAVDLPCGIHTMRVEYEKDNSSTCVYYHTIDVQCDATSDILVGEQYKLYGTVKCEHTLIAKAEITLSLRLPGIRMLDPYASPPRYLVVIDVMPPADTECVWFHSSSRPDNVSAIHITEDTVMNLELSKGVAVHGIIIRSGQGVPGMNITIQTPPPPLDDGPDYTIPVITDNMGKFRVNLVPGEYSANMMMGSLANPDSLRGFPNRRFTVSPSGPDPLTIDLDSL